MFPPIPLDILPLEVDAQKVWTPLRKSGGIPCVSMRFSLSMEMSRLTRDGTAEPVCTTKFSGADVDRATFIFPFQLTTCRIGNLTIGAAWASVRKYSSQLYDRRNARLSLKIRLFKAEVMEAMLYGCATWTMRSQDFSSLRTAHHKLLLRIIGFRRKDRIGYKPLSYREVLERTGSERIETTIRKRQLGFAGALVRQGDSRLSKRVMFGRLAVQGPKRGGRPATSWVDCLQKNLEAFGAVPRKGKGRKWVAFGVVVKDGRDWMTAAKNMDKWHRGVERGAEALDSAWRRADLRQSNVQLQR